VIKTAVARIFSPRHVALSAGAKDGVKEGMVFVIYSLGDTIFDPRTGESLGELEIVKGRVKVIDVQDKVSQATTLSRTASEMVNPFEKVFPFAPRREYYSTQDELKVDIPQPFTVDLTVRIGDAARSVD
jgi:hypothetical protein